MIGLAAEHEHRWRPWTSRLTQIFGRFEGLGWYRRCLALAAFFNLSNRSFGHSQATPS